MSAGAMTDVDWTRLGEVMAVVLESAWKNETAELGVSAVRTKIATSGGQDDAAVRQSEPR